MTGVACDVPHGRGSHGLRAYSGREKLAENGMALSAPTLRLKQRTLSVTSITGSQLYYFQSQAPARQVLRTRRRWLSSWTMLFVLTSIVPILRLHRSARPVPPNCDSSEQYPFIHRAAVLVARVAVLVP